MAELFYRKLTGLPGGESPVVMVTTRGGRASRGLGVWSVVGASSLPFKGCSIESFQEREGRGCVSPGKKNVLSANKTPETEPCSPISRLSTTLRGRLHVRRQVFERSQGSPKIALSTSLVEALECHLADHITAILVF